MPVDAQHRPESNDLTEIAIVLDRSGSMMSLKDDMEGGLWATITEQHGQPGRCRVSLYQFDHVWEPVWEAKPSGTITPADCRLVPRGKTALHDAVVKSLAAIEARILGEPEHERPAKVAVIVITDGHENASRENDKHDARKAIARATDKFNWSFVFLAADPRGFDDGVQMSQSEANASVAAFTKAGVRAMHSATSVALSDYRAGRTKKVDLDDQG
jgi:Mg-chelatase subunit ChlD